MRELEAACPPIGGGVQGERAETLGRGVDRGGQPGRTGADHDDVVAALGYRIEGQAELGGDGAGGRPPEQSGRGDDDR